MTNTTSYRELKYRDEAKNIRHDYYANCSSYPTLSNEEYIELHKQGKYKEIIENSYRLCAKIIQKYKIKPHTEMYQDILHECIAELANVIEDWDYTTSAFSTYTYWYLQKACQQFLRKQNSALSFGCYQSYRDFSRDNVSLNKELNVKDINGENMTVADVLDSTSSEDDPCEALCKKEEILERNTIYQVLQDNLHPIEFQALEILFDKDNYSDDLLPWLRDTFNPIFEEVTRKYVGYAKNYEPKEIDFDREDILSSTIARNRILYRWRGMLKKRATFVIKQHQEQIEKREN